MSGRDPAPAPSSARFVDRHGLWNADMAAAAADIEDRIRAGGLKRVRLSFADQHGILRGKVLVADEVGKALRDGCAIVSSLLAKDTSHRTVFPLFAAKGQAGLEDLRGVGDMLMLPDPATFRVLPWSPDTGWLLCDLYFDDGRPVPYSTRRIMQDAVARLHQAGFDYVAGLEVELHIFKIEKENLALDDAGQPGTPPEVSLLTSGYQYLTETRYDQLDPILAILQRDLVALGLPLRSMEVEFGPSQCEIVLKPGIDAAAADAMMLLRSAVKQVCRRHGYHATFMCRPRIPHVMSSGWHLHQSLRDRRTGANAFMTADADMLTPTGRHFLAGLLAHAQPAAVFSTPTINGYRRYRANSLAPDRAAWARDNRGVMIRVVGSPGDPATRLENRIGEPAANPYLYMASQILSGLDGLQSKLDPGASADTAYAGDAPLLPRTLTQALSALRADAFFRDALGSGFVDYYLHIKDAEIARFEQDVTEWEHREYFEMF